MIEEITEVGKPQIVVVNKRNLKFKSVADDFEGSKDAETAFSPSMTDSSLYESIQSIEARCRRGEVVLQNQPYYDDDGTDADPVERIESPEQITEHAEELFSALSTGNKPESDEIKSSEPATLPVDNDGKQQAEG